GGALWLALTRPDQWAAVAVVCPDAMPGTEDLAANAVNLPIRLFQGELDPVVTAESTRAWHRRLLNAGAPVEYIEYPGVRHNAWDFAYKNGAIFAWFSQFRRNPNPDHIHFVTRSPRYNSAYGFRLDSFPTGQLAAIDATEARFQTQNLTAFTVLPRPASGHGPETPPGTVTIDGSPVRIGRDAPLAFTKSAAGWTLAGPTVVPHSVPTVSAAVSGRHIYVYPTMGLRTEADLAASRR